MFEPRKEKIKYLVYKELEDNGLDWDNITHCNRPKSFFELSVETVSWDGDYEDGVDEIYQDTPDEYLMGLLIFLEKDGKYHILKLTTHWYLGTFVCAKLSNSDSLPDDETWNKYQKHNYKVYN